MSIIVSTLPNIGVKTMVAMKTVLRTTPVCVTETPLARASVGKKGVMRVRDTPVMKTAQQIRIRLITVFGKDSFNSTLFRTQVSEDHTLECKIWRRI